MYLKASRFFIAVSILLAVWGTSGVRMLPGAAMLASSSLAFAAAMLHVGFGGEPGGGRGLLKNPFFIPGLAMLALGAIQILNPALSAAWADGAYRAEETAHIGWLPSGVSGDFAFSNTFKGVAELASAFFFACAAWTALRGGRPARFALKFFAANCALAALLAVFQERERIGGIYGVLYSPSLFFGPLTYVNAAGALFVLGAASACAAAVLDMRGGGAWKLQAAVWAACAAACAWAAYLSPSIGAKASGALFVLFFAALCAVVSAKRRFGAKWAAAAAMTVLAAAAIGAAAFVPKYYGELHNQKRASLSSRLQMYPLSWEIFSKAPVFGSGAGSYPYMAAQSSQPFARAAAAEGRNVNAAHNDLLTYLCEYGAAGGAAIAAAFALWAAALRRRMSSLGAANAAVACGAAACGAHSMADLFLHVPSTMFAFVLAMTLSCAVFERGRQ